jgi:protein-S-isoprenylcysteine O-methyltransferase Ste14
MRHVTRDSSEEMAAADRTSLIGWVLVGVQTVLLILFVVLPKRRSLFSTPDFLDVLGIILMIAGLAVLLIAFMGLGSALTPTPVPQQGAALRTGGIYSRVRHPIYSGILLAGLGFTLAVGSIWQVLLWVALAVFFYAKAFWEDRLLAEKHGVAWFDYADHVSGFIPRFWGSR